MRRSQIKWSFCFTSTRWKSTWDVRVLNARIDSIWEESSSELWFLLLSGRSRISAGNTMTNNAARTVQLLATNWIKMTRWILAFLSEWMDGWMGDLKCNSSSIQFDMDSSPGENLGESSSGKNRRDRKREKHRSLGQEVFISPNKSAGKNRTYNGTLNVCPVRSWRLNRAILSKNNWTCLDGMESL